MMDAGRFAAVLGVLWSAHNIGDHVIQTDHQAAGKSTSWWAMAGHVGSYTATQAAALGLLRAAGVPLRPGPVAAGLVFSAATHAFLDRRWPVVEVLRRTGSARFATPGITVHENEPGESTGALPLHGPYLADQALHHGCVAIAAAIIALGGRT